ncbi:MAG TPA: hypothetical protein VFV57_11665 [Limnobacter sp.]|nr:hypothetical protein [Limnobacter sp.]
MSKFRTEPDNSPSVELYAAIAEMSARLLKSAQQGLWDEFAEGEAELARLVQVLNSMPEDTETMTEADVLLRTVYLRQIMDDNNKTHLLVLERTQMLERALTLQSNNDKLERGYGGGLHEG